MPESSRCCVSETAKLASRVQPAKVLGFEMDFNEINRKAIARLIGKKRGLATEKECRDWVNDTINDKIMDALYSWL